MNPNHADFFPKGVNNFVDNMQYHSEVGSDGICRVDLGSPIVADADGIFADVDIASAQSGFATFAAAYTEGMQGEDGAGNAPYGRNVTVVLSGAGTPAVTVHGRDYLGQPVSESFVGAGATPVVGNKAFKWVDRVDSDAVAATTLDVGWGVKLGLPFKAQALIQENVNDAVPADAGTFVAAVTTDPQTATSGDPRGTYAPHANNVPNGTRSFRVLVQCDKNKLHGVKHYGT